MQTWKDKMHRELMRQQRAADLAKMTPEERKRLEETRRMLAKLNGKAHNEPHG